MTRQFKRFGVLAPVLRGLVLCGLALMLSASVATAKPTVTAGMPGALPVDGTLTPDGIKLHWTEAEPKFAGSVEVSRRVLGTSGTATWQVIAPNLGPVQAYLDRAATPGTAWEYRVRRMGRDVIDQGYWTGGRDVAQPDHRGLAVLVVEADVQEPLAADIARFVDDLTGDGWRVVRVSSTADRNPPAAIRLIDALEIRNDIREARRAHPDGDLSVILLGNVPLVFSGKVAPDGHDHEPHATDLFYVDLDGRWPSTGEGLLIPGEIPDGRIDGAIGRIDFSNMGAPDRATEVGWLGAYLQRNHDWRKGKTDVPLRAYAGSVGHLFIERRGVANITGPAAITEGGHADKGQEGRWLFGVDFGPWRGDDYFEAFQAGPVFAINFGSHKQKIGRYRNPMNGLMTPPNQALAVAWGARPAWRLHGMAMGETIGAAQVRTINNGPSEPRVLASTDYLPTGSYPFVHPIWGNLLGDPTLTAYPIQPVTGVTVARTDGGTRISWTPSPQPGATYRVYRIAADGRATLLDETDGATVNVLDPDGAAPRYMVRAVAPIEVPAGRLIVLSAGQFADTPTSP
ncbi:hypothetical protein [Pseudooceanicola onchidii]|uniref:hypothetical protein n=1 Tax=Pseudooceanicola onchidii TaxID=2562279 RepID=UPI0010AB3C27|nr:hypothetical protein [Pseudooceanicola onchidii]